MTKRMSERQRMILSLVVHDYIRTATPIGSKKLVERYRLEISPATVRAELAALTELGLLNQQHTSAGRSPTESGYRYFVGTLMKLQELSESTRRRIEHQFYQMQSDQGVDGWMKLSASILASVSGAISLVSAPYSKDIAVKHIALVGLSERQALMIVVTNTSQAQQRFVSLGLPMNQGRLTMIENEFNEAFAGLNSRQIREKILQGTVTRDSAAKADLAGQVAAAIAEVEASRGGEIYTDGLHNVISEPEFTETGEAHGALKLLGEKTVLRSILTKTDADRKIGGIQILIGGEGSIAALHHCSLVLARYGRANAIGGTIGILGPMRMPYAMNIPTVRFIAGILSDLVSDAFMDEKDEGEKQVFVSDTI